MKSVTNEVVMIRPVNFYANPETAGNNDYQHDPGKESVSVQQQALQEFDNFVALLKKKGVTVHVIQDTPTPSTPDSIFPNNWFSTHEGGYYVIYPMYAENRQQEAVKFSDTVQEIAYQKHNSNTYFRTIDYTLNRRVGVYLEGTGAMVLDRKNKIAYSCRSPRASEDLFQQFCQDIGYTPISFYAEQDGEGIYHTNVMMGIGEHIAIVCLEAITNEEERNLVKTSLENSGKVVISITPEQVKHFLGNTLELEGTEGNFLMMSHSAYHVLTKEQKELIELYVPIEHTDIQTIEYHGGGSVRCMLAEIYE